MTFNFLIVKWMKDSFKKYIYLIMSIEKRARCVIPTIKSVQGVFAKGGNFKDALAEAKKKISDPRRQALKFEPNLQHALAYSALGILGMVAYEWTRSQLNAHGGHLPSLIQVLTSTPIVAASVGETKVSNTPAIKYQGGGDRTSSPRTWGKNFDSKFGKH